MSAQLRVTIPGKFVKVTPIKIAGPMVSIVFMTRSLRSLPRTRANCLKTLADYNNYF